MTKDTGWSGRIKAAWRVIRSEEFPTSEPAPSSPSIETSAPDALGIRIAKMELDLQDRDGEIARLRAEYERVLAEAERATKAAGDAALHALARHLTGPLSQAVTMQAMADSGRDLRVADTLVLFARVERVLSDSGVVRIGAVGEIARFEPALHQRMSGGDVEQGDLVKVRFVGYRMGDTILAKAMVSRPAESVE